MRRVRKDTSVKLQYMDGRSAYRWVGDAKPVIFVPKDGHAELGDEWREFSNTGTRDYLGCLIYTQIP